MSLENIRIFDLNLWDAESLAMSSEATNFPGENTQHRWKKRQWRATGDTLESIRTVDGSSITASGFFVFFHNVTVSGVVTLQGSNDNWATAAFSQQMTRSDDIYVYIPTAAITYDDWGVWVQDASNPDGYVELGRIWMGEYYAPSPGYNPQISNISIDPSVTMQSTGGQVSILEYPQYKTWGMTFDSIQDKSRYDTFISRVGNSKEFVILKKPKNYALNSYPNPEDNSHYVQMVKHDEAPMGGAYYRANIKLREER